MDFRFFVENWLVIRECARAGEVLRAACAVYFLINEDLMEECAFLRALAKENADSINI